MWCVVPLAVCTFDAENSQKDCVGNFLHPQTPLSLSQGDGCAREAGLPMIGI